MKLHGSIGVQGVVTLTFIALSGCGGGDEGNKDDSQVVPPQPAPVSYVAEHTMRYVQPQDEFYFDLSENMASSDDSPVNLVNVSSLSSNESCEPVHFDSTGFVLSANSTKVCDYVFEVGAGKSTSANSERGSVANIRAIVAESVTVLPPISVTTTVGKPVSIDVPGLLNFLGYIVDTSKFQLQDEIAMPYGEHSSSIATASSVANEIVYEPGGDFTGTERILFSYSNDVEVLSGTIDISVSSESNTAPLVENFEWQNPSTGSKIAESETIIPVDVTKFVSDADGDALKITEVYSYDSNVKITGDLSFELSSSKLGKQYVTFFIDDGRKGYSSGTVGITIEPEISLIQDWEGIVYFDPHISSEVTFTAPASRAYADYIDQSYSEFFTGDGSNSPNNKQYVGYSFEQAKDLCKMQGGRLPTERELKLLVVGKGNLFDSDNWPASLPYWVDYNNSESMVQTVNVTNGATESKSIESSNLATCVLFNSEEIKDFTVVNKTLSIVNGYTVISGELLNPEGDLAPYKKIDIQLLDNFKGALTSDTEMTDGSGMFSIEYEDFSFEPNAYVSSIYRVIEKAIIPSDRKLFLLPLTEEENWARLALKHVSDANLDLFPISESGLPLLRNDSQNSNVYHGRSYVGDQFIAEISTYTPSVAISGKYSFFIQQVGNNPDSSWGRVSLQPGAPNSDKVFSVVINIWNNKVDIFSGYGSLLSSYENIDLSGSRKIWLEVRKGTFSLYTSTDGRKPELPMLVTDMDWSTIDTNSEYWIGLGAYNANQVDGTELNATELLVRAFLKNDR
ncbi:hypothetical protein ACPV47_23780 [Vibrio jasicida]|uniref:hypothetical protein n=1 Tax=Vibrio jasicida TaxID=766224 RepID=UPI00406839CD